MPEPDVTPFPVSVAEEDLQALRNRLGRTRWPDRENVADSSQGPQLDRIRALCEYWMGDYDWRRAERDINQAGSSRTFIDGLGIHFLHVRSPQPEAVPLLLCHGWPGSILEFRHLIGSLTDPARHGGNPADAFHLVIPSMPGFGYSDRPTTSGWDVSRTAQAWDILMQRLGYECWFAQGGDWGAAVIEALSRVAPQRLRGLHFNFPLVFPDPDEMAQATPEEARMLARAQRYDNELSAYSKQQAT